MDRRQFLKQAMFGLTAACSVGAVSSCQGVQLQNKTMGIRAGNRKPNVIFILADDLGYNELGSYGQKKIKTPNLDKMAAEGMRFTQHYSGQAVCAPSRCALMTGKHMGHAYIRDNYEIGGGYQFPISEETLTIAEVFKTQGYATGASGKWGLGGPDSVGHPNKQGFDLFYGNLGQVQAHWYYPPYMWKNDQKITFEGNENYTGKYYSHDFMAAEALQFIRDNKEKPFFLYVPFILPHVSLQVPQDSLDEYLKENWEETPFPTSHYAGHDQPRACYAAMITRMDRSVGEIFDLLKELDLDDNTIVFFSGDNGTTYCCGVDYDFFESVGPLRGLKGSLYEGGIRVPLIARWPGKIKPGTQTDLLSAFWDFFPTCCDLIGVKTPGDIDGISMLPTLVGEPQKQKHEYLYWEFRSYGAQQAVRLGKWKGYRKDITKTPNPPLELYDLDTDIGEQNNVAASHPDIVAQIEQIMAEAHEYSGYFPILPGEANLRTQKPVSIS